MSNTDRVLDYVVKHFKTTNSAPTVREIGAAVGISSTSVVNYHLNKLAAAGKLKREDFLSRGLVPAGLVTLMPGDLVTVNVGGELVEGLLVAA